MTSAGTARFVGPATLRRLLGDWRADGPVYGDLARRLSQVMLDGRLGVNVRLPAERALAAALQVSRTTVTASYALLREQGFLVSRRGSGSVTRLPDDAVGRLTPWTPAVVPLTEPTVLDLTAASMAAPAGLDEVYAAAADDFARDLAGNGYVTGGLPELRGVIAERYCARGVPTTAEHILVTSGAQQAIDLVFRHVIRAREAAIVESPTYAGALDALRAVGARVVGVDVAESGWDTPSLADSAQHTGARIAYMIPDHHNPTGRLMADDQRAELVRALARQHVTIVADESLAEMGLEPGMSAPRPLAAFDRAGCVISVGSLSKPVWGGLRIGWVRATPATVTALANTLASTVDLGTPPFEQRVAIRVFAQLDRLLDERLRLLRQRRELFLAQITDTLGWRVLPPVGGLSAWVELPAARSTALADVAARFGVLLIAGPRLSADGALDRYIRLPFALPPDFLRLAVQRLQQAWSHLDGIATRRGEPAPELTVSTGA